MHSLVAEERRESPLPQSGTRKANKLVSRTMDQKVILILLSFHGHSNDRTGVVVERESAFYSVMKEKPWSLE